MGKKDKESAIPKTGLCIKVCSIDRVEVQVDCPFLVVVIVETWRQVQRVQPSCLDVRQVVNDGLWVVGRDREGLEAAKGSELRPLRKVIETSRLESRVNECQH